MKKFGFSLIPLCCLGAIQLFGGMFGVAPAIASTDSDQVQSTSPEPALPASIQRLSQMFSPDIQNIVNACWEQGRANLAMGADEQGELVCGDGSAATGIAYTDYVSTISDLLAASSLVGFRAVVQTDPRVNPQMLAAFLSNPQGSEMLRRAVQSAVTQSQLVTIDADVSSTILTDQVVNRVVPALQDPTRLETLLGNSEQYAQVVENFCTPPGMSIEEAQAIIPDVDTLQLYAICIQESGAADEILQMVNQ